MVVSSRAFLPTVTAILGPVLFAVTTGHAQPAAPHQPADLVITNGYVVTMNDKKDVIESGAVVVKDARIVAVGPTAVAAGFAAAKTIDARGAIVMPGMINTHTHASMTVFRGLGDDVPDRLRRFIFPLEKTIVNRELVYWGALHGLIEMIEGGVTTFADMYYFEDEVGRAAKALGMRGVVGETVLNFAAPDAPEPYGGFDYARAVVAKFKGDPLVTPAVAPHAPYSLDADHLKQAQKEAETMNVPLLIHLAEMPDEVETLRKERNQTPVEYLDSLGLLTSRTLAAHCIFVTPSDIATLKARDVGVAHAMVANIKSAKGVSPALQMFKDGVRVGLGTDGPMSGNTLDIIGQLGYVAKVHKLSTKDRNVMPAIDVVEMATRGGARALHMDDRIGSLETGKLADIAIVDRDSTHMVPFYDAYSALVYAANPGDVRTTIVHGKIVMEDRRILTVDVGEVRAWMRKTEQHIRDTVLKTQ